MRILLLLAAVLALVPASGATLCVADSGHVAIELADGACPPVEAPATSCLEACGDCEDTPLSVGSAQRAVHVGIDIALLPATTPVAPCAVAQVVTTPSLARTRTSLPPLVEPLRC